MRYLLEQNRTGNVEAITSLLNVRIALCFGAIALNLIEITKLSNEGQVLIPKALRDAYHWEAGQELMAIDTGDGILVKPKKPFQETTLEQVLGCLQYHGTPHSIEDMEAAIDKDI